MKDRIRQIMEAQHMTQQVFAQFIEMSPASLSSIFNGRTKPTLNIIEAIKKKIPDINTDWLMFGTGSMFVEEQTQGSSGLFDQQPTDSKPLESGNDTSTPTHPNSTAATNNLFSGENAHKPSHNYNGVNNTRQEIIREEIKYIDKPQRKITEIRVYFDDLTYETFVPAKK